MGNPGMALKSKETVRRQLQWLKGGASFAEPKSAKSLGTNALPAMALAALRRHRVRQAQERLALGEAWQDIGLAFTTPIGTAPNPSGLRNRSFFPPLDPGAIPSLGTAY